MISASSAPTALRSNCLSFCDFLEALGRVADVAAVYEAWRSAAVVVRPPSPAAAPVRPVAPAGKKGARKGKKDAAPARKKPAVAAEAKLTFVPPVPAAVERVPTADEIRAAGELAVANYIAYMGAHGRRRRQEPIAARIRRASHAPEPEAAEPTVKLATVLKPLELSLREHIMQVITTLRPIIVAANSAGHRTTGNW